MAAETRGPARGSRCDRPSLRRLDPWSTLRWSVKNPPMSASQHSVARAEEFTRMAALAQSELERDGYTELAAAYARLAADAAIFEARYGSQLDADR